MNQRELKQEDLKLIACVAMLIDHFGYAIVPEWSVAHMTEIYYACRIIGRLAFPIYCFLLAEGMQHTRNPKNYILRLGLGILLAELPFDILFNECFTWENQSVMVTLTLGAVMLLCMQKTEQKWQKLLITIPFAMLTDLAKSDYGGWGIAMLAVFALTDRVDLQLLGLLLVNGMMESVLLPIFGIPVSGQLFAVFALLPITLYSGEKRTHSRVAQWGFYLFYPLHLLVLWMILGIIR